MIIFVFLWCVLAHLYPVEDNKNRISKYDIHMLTLCIEGALRVDSLEFPMKVKDIP